MSEVLLYVYGRVLVRCVSLVSNNPCTTCNEVTCTVRQLRKIVADLQGLLEEERHML